MSFTRFLDGSHVFVIDCCELVERAATEKDEVAISSIPSIAPESDFGWCQRCNKFRLLFNGTCGDCLPKELEATKDVCPTCGVPYGDEVEKLEALRPVRYEIKTLLQDLEDSSADNSLSQLLNDGWEIIELSHHTVEIFDLKRYGTVQVFRRVVTLRRAVDLAEWAKKEYEKAQPHLQTLSSAIETIKEIVGADGEDG